MLKAVSGEIVSLATQRAARNLVVASAIFIFIDLFQLKPVDWPLLQSDLSLEHYRLAALCIVFFLCASLFLNWWSDFIQYRDWFSSFEVHLGTIEGNSRFNPREHVLSGLSRKIQSLNSSLDEFPEGVNKLEGSDKVIADAKKVSGQRLSAELRELLNSIQSLERKTDRLVRYVDDIGDLTNEIRNKFARVDRVTKLIVIVWYFAVPLSLGFFALTLLILT